MNPYNFKDAKNTPSLRFIGTGIHEVTIMEIYYQPAGESVKGERKRELTPGANEGPLVEFSKAQTRIVMQVDKTVQGNESKGATVVVSLYEPSSESQAKFEGQINRIYHILLAMTKEATIPQAEAYIKAFNGQSTEEFANYIKRGFTGKQARYKFIADQNGKYAQLPNYYSGFAECVDSPLRLKYNEEKEGLVKKSNVELAADDADIRTSGLTPERAITPSAAVTASPSEVNIFAENDDLPF